jgi:hypothetical protein
VKIGAEAALFPEKEYINGIAVAVWTLYISYGETGWVYSGTGKEHKTHSTSHEWHICSCEHCFKKLDKNK